MGVFRNVILRKFECNKEFVNVEQMQEKVNVLNEDIICDMKENEAIAADDSY